MKLTFQNLTLSIRAHILQQGHLPLRGPPFSVARILRVYFSVRPRTQIKYYHTFFSIQYILEHYTMALIKVDIYLPSRSIREYKDKSGDTTLGFFKGGRRYLPPYCSLLVHTLQCARTECNPTHSIGPHHTERKKSAVKTHLKVIPRSLNNHLSLLGRRSQKYLLV